MDAHHPVQSWLDLIRRRPAMYVGDLGRLGLRGLARDLFEVPRNPRILKVEIDGPRFRLSAASIPISALPRAEGKPLYLVEVTTGIEVPLDEPASIAPLEIVDVMARPVAFIRVPTSPPVVAIVRALSSEMTLASRRSGALTAATFSRGMLVAEPATTATSDDDGVELKLLLDSEIFAEATFCFEDLAHELRDFSLRRGCDVELRDSNRRLLFVMKKGAV